MWNSLRGGRQERQTIVPRPLNHPRRTLHRLRFDCPMVTIVKVSLFGAVLTDPSVCTFLISWVPCGPETLEVMSGCTDRMVEVRVSIPEPNGVEVSLGQQLGPVTQYTKGSLSIERTASHISHPEMTVAQCEDLHLHPGTLRQNRYHVAVIPGSSLVGAVYIATVLRM